MWLQTASFLLMPWQPVRSQSCHKNYIGLLPLQIHVISIFYKILPISSWSVLHNICLTNLHAAWKKYSASNIQCYLISNIFFKWNWIWFGTFLIYHYISNVKIFQMFRKLKYRQGMPYSGIYRNIPSQMYLFIFNFLFSKKMYRHLM